jgi:hypothetical protein
MDGESKINVPALQPAESSGLARLIERAASDPSFDVEKMERLVAMHERSLDRQAQTAFHAAMAEAQRDLTPVREDASNSQTHSKYATYLALDRVVRPIYAKHGFAISFGQGSGAPEGHVRVEALVSHTDGHSRSYHLDMPADGKGAKGGDVMTKTHATGSALTYGRRYLLALIFNLAIGGMQDDDGNRAGAEPITAEQKEQIVALIKETASDTARLLKFISPRGAPLTSIDEIPAHKFAAVVAELERKKAKQGAKP